MGKAKRVLFSSIGLNGAGVRDSYTYNFVTKEMERLVERGVEVYFFHEKFDREVSVRGVKCLGASAYRRVSKIRIFKYALKNFVSIAPALLMDVRRALWAVKINLAIVDLASDLMVDAVHNHFLYPMGSACFLVTKKTSIPLVCTLRGAELHNRDDLNYGASRDALYRNFSKVGLHCAQKITVPNSELAEMLTSERTVDDSKIEVLPNGFDSLTVRDKLETDREDREFYKFIAVGNLIELKNHGVILRAISSACESVKRKISLTIVGKGPLEGTLNEMAGELDKINIVGEVDRITLHKMIADSDCLLHPSYLEGMPNVVLEALSLGVPCVVSDISAHRMIIENNVNGFIFKAEDERALLEIFCHIVGDPVVIDSMRDAAILSSQRFSLDKKIDRYIEIYQELMSQDVTQERL